MPDVSQRAPRYSTTAVTQVGLYMQWKGSGPGQLVVMKNTCPYVSRHPTGWFQGGCPAKAQQRLGDTAFK